MLRQTEAKQRDGLDSYRDMTGVPWPKHKATFTPTHPVNYGNKHALAIFKLNISKHLHKLVWCDKYGIFMVPASETFSICGPPTSEVEVEYELGNL